MNRRTFGVLAAAPLMPACFWDQHFNLDWEEEIPLHDGRVLLAKIVYTFERIQSGLTRYGGRAILRDTLLTFDAGDGRGAVSQLIKGGWPLILDQLDGVWFLVFSWHSNWSPSLLGGQDWGPDQNGNGQRSASLQGTQFKPIPICGVPSQFEQINFLFPVRDIAELARLNGTRVSVQLKKAYLAAQPLGPGYARIQRPPIGAGKSCGLASQLEGAGK